MKRRILFLNAVFFAFCLPAFAGQNWVDQFLNRYKPAPLNLIVRSARRGFVDPGRRSDPGVSHSREGQRRLTG